MVSSLGPIYDTSVLINYLWMDILQIIFKKIGEIHDNV